MKKIFALVSLLVVAAACAAPPTNQVTPSTNANANTAATAPAGMTEAVAITTEKAVWDTIKEKDYDAFASMLASDQIEVSPDGVRGKAASVASVKDFEPSEVNFSDWKFLPIDKDAFVVIYNVNVKGKYKGKEFPPDSARCSSAWVNRDNKWVAIFHQECPIKPATPAPTKPGATKPAASPAAPPASVTTGSDPAANEKLVWDLFKSKNYDAFAQLLAPNFIEVEPDKVYDRAGSIEGVKQFDASKSVLSDWQSLKLDEDAALVTYMVKDPGFAPNGERHATIWVNRDGKWLGLLHHGGTPVTKPSAATPPKTSASPAAKAPAQ
jgi:hypothetical protein